MMSGEPQCDHYDDASADFLPSEEELPAWLPGGVKALDAPAQFESTASLAAGECSHTHTS